MLKIFKKVETKLIILNKIMIMFLGKRVLFFILRPDPEKDGSRNGIIIISFRSHAIKGEFGSNKLKA